MLPRVAGVVAAERLAEEALGRLLVALGAEQEVDGLAGAVDGAIEIAPLTVDPEVGLIDVPRPAARPEMPARALLELGGEALDPAVHGGVVDLDPAIGEHALEVAVADRELQVPAHRPEDHLGRETIAAKGPGRGHPRRSSCRCVRGAPLLAAHGPPLKAMDPGLPSKPLPPPLQSCGARNKIAATRHWPETIAGDTSPSLGARAAGGRRKKGVRTMATITGTNGNDSGAVAQRHQPRRPDLRARRQRHPDRLRRRRRARGWRRRRRAVRQPRLRHRQLPELADRRRGQLERF